MNTMLNQVSTIETCSLCVAGKPSKRNREASGVNSADAFSFETPNRDTDNQRHATRLRVRTLAGELLVAFGGCVPLCEGGARRGSYDLLRRGPTIFSTPCRPVTGAGGSRAPNSSAFSHTGERLAESATDRREATLQFSGRQHDWYMLSGMNIPGAAEMSGVINRRGSAVNRFPAGDAGSNPARSTMVVPVWVNEIRFESWPSEGARCLANRLRCRLAWLISVSPRRDAHKYNGHVHSWKYQHGYLVCRICGNVITAGGRAI